MQLNLCKKIKEKLIFKKFILDNKLKIQKCKIKKT